MEKVSDIMEKNTKTIDRNTTLKDANAIMQENKIRHLLIVDIMTGKLEGIISDRDIKKFTSPFVGSSRESEQDKATLNIRVEKIMRKDVITCQVDDTVKKCLETMLSKKISAIPVVKEENKIAGIITTTNLLKLLLNKL